MKIHIPEALPRPLRKVPEIISATASLKGEGADTCDLRERKRCNGHELELPETVKVLLPSLPYNRRTVRLQLKNTILSSGRHQLVLNSQGKHKPYFKMPRPV